MCRGKESFNMGISTDIKAGLSNLLWIRVRDIKPLTQKLVRVPLKYVSGKLPKHLHLHSRLLVTDVILEKDSHLFHQVATRLAYFSIYEFSNHLPKFQNSLRYISAKVHWKLKEQSYFLFYSAIYILMLFTKRFNVFGYTGFSF